MSRKGISPLWNLQEWRDEAEEWRGAHMDSGAVEILADDFDACFHDGVIAGKAEMGGDDDRDELIDELITVLRVTEAIFGFDLKRMITFGSDYNQAVKDVYDRVVAALAKADTAP